MGQDTSLRPIPRRLSHPPFSGQNSSARLIRETDHFGAPSRAARSMPAPFPCWGPARPAFGTAFGAPLPHHLLMRSGAAPNSPLAYPLPLPPWRSKRTEILSGARLQFFQVKRLLSPQIGRGETIRGAKLGRAPGSEGARTAHLQPIYTLPEDCGAMNAKSTGEYKSDKGEFIWHTTSR
jgi:hypothetical protein